MVGLNIPKDLASEEANEYLKNACLKYDNKCARPQTTALCNVRDLPNNSSNTPRTGLGIILQYNDIYQGLSNGEHLEGVSVSLAGQIMNKDSSDAKLVFYDLKGGVKVIADAWISDLDEVEFCKFHSTVERGDTVGVIGFPGKSEEGDLSIFPKTFTVLSHCLHLMPDQKSTAAAAANNANLMRNPWVPGILKHTF
ncbi:lysine--tRNA ligase, cytoplasmic-like [Medicago truncatula]|uniref:lysine--tRNA ligase, cytoplasmic-like n=1 Tax=Medicago truncatula TaxID=3880 RepID=UPI000D2F4739|nr:lysine--tRNA ligase, cytoplasmic-like [Medicago truncatula]